ncbi:MAG: lipid-A-disaccharide synthase N-terminal domain-containing protein [Desulfobacterales bacterium]
MSSWWAEFHKVMLNPWAVVGFLGQALFFSRWIVQWIASEKRKVSYVPLSFWFISLAGGLLVLVYAIQRHDPVFILGQLVGVSNYARNIVLIHRQGRG